MLEDDCEGYYHYTSPDITVISQYRLAELAAEQIKDKILSSGDAI
jgi:hypothetical protein